jgi:hypothetical protein
LTLLAVRLLQAVRRDRPRSSTRAKHVVTVLSVKAAVAVEGKLRSEPNLSGENFGEAGHNVRSTAALCIALPNRDTTTACDMCIHGNTAGKSSGWVAIKVRQ